MQNQTPHSLHCCGNSWNTLEESVLQTGICDEM